MSDTPETDKLVRTCMAIGDAIGMASKLTLKCMDLERERDEAVRSCHIWQTGHSELVKERDKWIGLCDSATAERDNTLLGKLVAFDCREKMLTFEMSQMPSTGTFGESFYISQNQPK